MNDPGLEEPIHEAASQANETLGKSKSDGHETSQSSEPLKARWFYASTMFPLFAGTFGPMANAFSICALVENWRVEIPPGGTEEHGIDIKDPRALIAINAVSLVFALMANLSLLLNMAKRLRFEIAQPITIIGFWLASVLLIGLLSWASTESFQAPGVTDQALTQAYYYAIFAASLYQIISYLMCVTVYGAYRGVYSKSFELTMAQRTLMLQTISFLVYLEVGALIYSHIEGWRFLDAVYFMDFTLLTVGIGDYAPATHLGRSLLFPFAIGGIITIGLVVSSIRSLILDRGAEKMSARLMEKTRARVVEQVASVGKHRKSAGKSLFGIQKSTAHDLARDPVDDHSNELKRRKTEFEVMRHVQDMAARERKYTALGLSTTAFAILWFVGAVVFQRAERNQQWTYFQALYFSYTSILTIGYGDLSPMSNSGKPFFVFWSLLAVPTLTILISNMGDTVVKGVKDATIWLGEVSFLPSSDARTFDRLKRGAYHATLGQLKFVKGGLDDQENQTKLEQENHGWDDMRQMHPGLVQLFDSSDRQKIDKKDLETLNHMAKVLGAAEEEGEGAAKEQKDERARVEHHYRHLLVAHIPKIYADTKLSTPKKYSYGEWGFYLRLLGEDEANSSLHRRALPKTKSTSTSNPKQSSAKHEERSGHTKACVAKEHEDDPKVDTKWSWIGQRSPLMQDKDEAEWILERLFEKLEESMRAQVDTSMATHDVEQSDDTRSSPSGSS